MINPYRIIASAAVQAKRIATGMYGQTKHTQFLESIQYLPPEILKTLQAEKLSLMLLHAVDKIPEYQKYKGQLELSPSTVFKDIKDFPIITKEMYRDNFNSFVDFSSPYIEKLCTGGTSSVNVTLLRDKSAMLQRNNEYFDRVLGMFPGMSRINLSRHEKSYHVNNNKVIEIEENKLMRSYFVNSSYFGEQKLEYLYNLYKKLKPEILKGNTAAIYDFAKAIEKNNWERVHIPIIYGGVSTMLPIYIETLGKVFGSEVYNAYGATEVNIVCAQCKEKGGMHYIPNTHFIEILKDDGSEAEEDETGVLYITMMTNMAMPIIRYKIGDYATATNKMCSCGRSFPMIKNIEGRLMESLMSPKGTFMSITGFKVILNNIQKVEDFQAIQTKDDSLVLNLICKEKLDENEIAYINLKMTEILDYKMNIEIRYINQVEKLPNGKILRVIALKH